MRRLAASVGCQVVSFTEYPSLVDGRVGRSYLILCPSHEAKVELLDALAWWDAKHDMQLRELILRLVKGESEDPEGLARWAHTLVQRAVRFVRTS
jgi:hypothetical protein